MQSPSRRDVLAAGGVLAGLGVGYYVGTTQDATTGPRSLSWADTDWPYPDYDAANTRNPPAASAPTGDDLDVAWRRSLDDVTHRARPVVANNKVYTASVDGQTDRLRAFSTTDGEEVWRREDHTGPPSSRPTVLAPGASLYYRFATFDGAPLGAVDQSTGDGVWGASIPPGGSWTVGGGRVYFLDQLNEAFQAYDARTGDELWASDGPEIQSVNAFHPEYGLFGWRYEALHAYDPADGSERWSVPFEYPRETVVAGGLAVTTRASWGDDGDVVVAFDAGGGAEAWRYELPDDGRDEEDVPYFAAAASDDVVVVLDGGSGDSPDGLSAVAAATGDRRWRVTPPEGLSSFTHATLVGETVYVCGVGGDDSRASELLRFSLDGGSQTGSWSLPDFPRAVVVADGQVLVQTRTELLAFE